MSKEDYNPDVRDAFCVNSSEVVTINITTTVIKKNFFKACLVIHAEDEKSIGVHN